MQVRHRDDVMKNVLWQTLTAKRVTPLFKGHIHVADGSSKCRRELCSQRMHILRLWAGELVNLADVARRIRQNRRNDLRHVLSIDGRGLPLTEG